MCIAFQIKDTSRHHIVNYIAQLLRSNHQPSIDVDVSSVAWQLLGIFAQSNIDGPWDHVAKTSNATVAAYSAFKHDGAFMNVPIYVIITILHVSASA